MGGEAPGLWFDDVKLDGADPKLSTYPGLLLPGCQTINRNIRAKA
jgi:hypothetical protein